MINNFINESCEHLEDILEYERGILKEQEHKAEYIRLYGQSMRDLYCGHICPYQKDCSVYKKGDTK